MGGIGKGGREEGLRYRSIHLLDSENCTPHEKGDRRGDRLDAVRIPERSLEIREIRCITDAQSKVRHSTDKKY